MKNSIYIYQFGFLLETKKLFLRLIKSDELPSLFINNNIKDKYLYIQNIILDSKYYFREDAQKIQEILKYYSQYLFESKKEDIQIIKELLKNNEGNYKKYLKDYEIAKKMNKRFQIILYMFKNEYNFKIESEIGKAIKKWEIIEKIVINKKIKKLKKQYKESLNNFFLNEKNKESLLKIFDKETIDFYINVCKINNNYRQFSDFKKKCKENPDYFKISKKEENNNKNINNLNNRIEIINSEKENIIENKENEYSNNNDKNGNDISTLNDNEKDIKKNENKFSEGFDLELSSILNKSSFLISIYKYKSNFYFFYDKINFGENKILISAQKLAEFEEYINNKKNRNNIGNNYKELLNFIDEFKLRIKNEFMLNYFLKIKLDFQKENDNIVDDDDSFYNITCNYTFFEPINNNKKIYREENILINKTNSNSQGFQFLIYEINNERYEKNTPKFITELSNGYYFGLGEENKIYIYNKYFHIKMIIKRFKSFKGSISNIFENDYQSDPIKKSEIIICSDIKFFLLTIYPEISKFKLETSVNLKKRMKKYNIKEINYLYIFNNDKTFSKGIYIKSLKISYNYYALISSKKKENGEDKLILYNIKKKEIKKEIRGFSFINEPNGIALMKNKKYKNLICVCMDDYEEQKNGILLISLLLNDKKLFLSFKSIGKFKPYCICPLKIYLKEEKNIIFNENKINADTDYFLIGGFDLEKGEGKIKLFKLLECQNEFFIKFIRDIESNRFESTIIKLIQSKIDGKIVALCYNGEKKTFDIPGIVK